MGKSLKIAVLANTAWYLFNFKRNLMLALKREGHSVLAISPMDRFVEVLREGDIRHVGIEITRNGMNPLKEVVAIIRLSRLLKKEKIDILLTYTPKGNIYGGFAAQAARIDYIPNLSGLGRVFTSAYTVSRLVKFLYKVSFRRAGRIFFQNREDMAFFVDKRLVDKNRSAWVPGSGVDTGKFKPEYPESKRREEKDGFVFLLVARMLWDKGIGEFVEAAKVVKKKYPRARFQLLGYVDTGNPSAISMQVIEEWKVRDEIEYMGYLDEVLPALRNADCVVLPSYREGMPRSLLEAASVGKPIVTTNTPGCKEAIVDGVTGYLSRSQDHMDLARQMIKIMELTKEEKKKMGEFARRRMVERFDERYVIGDYLDAINTIMGIKQVWRRKKK